MTVLIQPPFTSGDQVDSRNRSQVKKWLRDCGVSSSVTERLTISQLRAAIDNPADTVAKLLDGVKPQQPQQQQQPQQPQQQPEQQQQQGFEDMTPAPTKQQPAQGVDQQQQQINQVSQILTDMMNNQGSGVDEGRIIELIEQHGRKPDRFEIQQGAEIRQIDERPHKALDSVLQWLAVGVDVYVVGPAGSGKTTMARQAAQALDLDFHFTAKVDSAARLLGYNDAHGKYVSTVFRDWCENGGLFLFDEIDASCPNALTAFNQALANRQCAFPDGIVKLHPSCVAVAAANTVGTGSNRQYVGRARLDAATLDRFVFVDVGYDEDLERDITGCDEWVKIVQAYRRAADELSIAHVISPRASLYGAKLFNKLPRRELIKQTILKGLDDDTASRLETQALEHAH